MTITTATVTLLSNDQGPRGRQGWSLVLASHPKAPVWVSYSGDMQRDPGPHFLVPRDTLTVTQGGPGQVAPGRALYLHAPPNTSFTFTEIAR